jgi:CubicO group peptidase (beta-lactamase class C family)
MGRFKILSVLLSSLAALALGQGDNSTLQGLTLASIAALNKAMHKWVDSGKGANMVTLLARHGKIVNHDAYGYYSAKNKSTGNKVRKDSIYNIMSMTKPVVGATMLTFYDEGRFKLDDLVSKHIPAFGNLKVKTGGNLSRRERRGLWLS